MKFNLTPVGWILLVAIIIIGLWIFLPRSPTDNINNNYDNFDRGDNHEPDQRQDNQRQDKQSQDKQRQDNQSQDNQKHDDQPQLPSNNVDESDDQDNNLELKKEYDKTEQYQHEQTTEEDLNYQDKQDEVQREYKPDITKRLPAKQPVQEAEVEAEELKVKVVSKGERLCREFLESYFKKPFVTVRPNWLKNPETLRNLELDCYNEELNLAVEYNGKQHYRYPNSFHKTEEDVRNQARRDMMKESLCTLNGVRLIVVPYTVPYDDIGQYILEQLNSKKFNRNYSINYSDNN